MNYVVSTDHPSAHVASLAMSLGRLRLAAMVLVAVGFVAGVLLLPPRQPPRKYYLTPEQAMRRKNVYESRRAAVRAACKEYFATGTNNGSSYPSASSDSLSNVMFFPAFNASYCAITRAAASAWIDFFAHETNFASLFRNGDIGGNGGGDEDRRGLMQRNMLRAYSLPSELPAQFKQSFFRRSLSFAFVRHPFVRLASSYRRLVADGAYASWGHKVPTKSGLRDDAPTFSDFADYLTADGGEVADSDPHTRRYWKTCPVCPMQFKVLGKFETLGMDSRYLMDMLGKYNSDDDVGVDGNNRSDVDVFGSHRYLFPQGEEGEAPGGRREEEEETEQLAKRYFATLDVRQAEELHRIYRLDFDAFGYKPDRFFKVTKTNRKQK